MTKEEQANAPEPMTWARWKATLGELAAEVGEDLADVQDIFESANGRTFEQMGVAAFARAMVGLRSTHVVLRKLADELGDAPAEAPEKSANELRQELTALGHTEVLLWTDEDGWTCQSRLPLRREVEEDGGRWRARSQQGWGDGPSVAAAMQARIDQVHALRSAQAEAVEQIDPAAVPATQETQGPAGDAVAPEIPF